MTGRRESNFMVALAVQQRGGVSNGPSLLQSKGETMIEVSQNLWDVDADVRCVTTNGTIRFKDGLWWNVMGGGCAKEAAIRYPRIAATLGGMIHAHGNHVYLLTPNLVAFPTKEDVRNPSTPGRITQSLFELSMLQKIYGWEKVALPRPGSGLGGLNYERDVRPMVSVLGDWLIIVDFPKPVEA
jgi:hypothetical protein